MVIIDEGVMLRYLLNDNRRLADEAAVIIGGGQAYTYPELIARVAETLRDLYGVPRTMIGEALTMLLDDVCVAEADVVRLACRYFGTTRLDFTDCLLMARNVQRGWPVASFDKAIMRRMLP